jgi:hypothetical protein
MKFNMGCGSRKLAGFVNVDAQALCSPDQVFDLETTPWPWPSDSAEEIVFNHSLEHPHQRGRASPGAALPARRPGC